MTRPNPCPSHGFHVGDNGVCSICGKTPAEVREDWRRATEDRKDEAAEAHERIAAYIAEQVSEFAALHRVQSWMVDADLRSETSFRTGGGRIYITLKVRE